MEDNSHRQWSDNICSWRNQIITSWIIMFSRQTITLKPIKPLQLCLHLHNQLLPSSSCFPFFSPSSVFPTSAEGHGSTIGTKRILFSAAELWVHPFMFLCNSISYRTPFTRAIYLFQVTFHPLCLNDVQRSIWDCISKVFWLILIKRGCSVLLPKHTWRAALISWH